MMVMVKFMMRRKMKMKMKMKKKMMMMMMRLRRKIDPKTGEAHLVRAGAIETQDTPQEPFCVEFSRKMPDLNPARAILCGNVQ